jgi:AbiV family abortive infection protein
MAEELTRDQIENSVKDCLLNAQHHLAAAKALRELGADFVHIAYHNAVICIEEVGKALILQMTLTAGEKQSTLGSYLDDHVKKLFWALWSPRFGRSDRTVQEFRAIQEGARKIHERRLETLYVDTSIPRSDRQAVTKDELENILVFAESRLELEKVKTFEEPSDSEKEDLKWFLSAADDSNLKLLVWSGQSFSKLAEFEGDVRAWVKWLRTTAKEAEKRNNELLERELRRGVPEELEGDKPKWQLEVRLYSSSHSIRPKVVKGWNKTVEAIKLRTTDNKNELHLEFIIHKRVPVQALWTAAWYSASTFVCALNIATRGFFWWYLPVHVSRFYTEIRDLESKAQVNVDRSPELRIDWGQPALQETDLNATALTYGYLTHSHSEKREGLEHYFRGLSMIAKNDVFLQFEFHALMEFYFALKAEFRRSGEWDGVAPFVETAVKRFERFVSDAVALQDVLKLAEKLSVRELPASPISLGEVASMKVFCDLYFSLLTQKFFVEMRARQND